MVDDPGFRKYLQRQFGADWRAGLRASIRNGDFDNALREEFRLYQETVQDILESISRGRYDSGYRQHLEYGYGGGQKPPPDYGP